MAYDLAVTYDIAVVGLGMIGAGALRHTSLAGVEVVGIGPAEPVASATHAGPFASHYDSGRITRRIDDRIEWAVLAGRSIDEYPAIADASGVDFHHAVGCAFVRNDEAGIERARGVAADLDIAVEFLDAVDLQRRWPELSFPSGWSVVYDPPPAGYVDPRRLITAELSAAQRGGAEVYRNVVTTLERRDGGYRLRCDDGAEFSAETVIVATGAYGNDLLPEPLAYRVAPEAVILGEVDVDASPRLAELPSLIYFLDHPEYDDAYAVPATTYPDGKQYIKLGAAHTGAGELQTNEEKHAWMTGRTADAQLDSMRGILQGIFPAVEFAGFTIKPCLITDTSHGLPFVDQLDFGLYVAFGGNGRAAKSSDAIGKLASDLALHGRWTDPQLDSAAFRVDMGRYEPKPGSRHVR